MASGRLADWSFHDEVLAEVVATEKGFEAEAVQRAARNSCALPLLMEFLSIMAVVDRGDGSCIRGVVVERI